VKMIVVLVLVAGLLWWYYQNQTPVHNVATGGLPTSNR
jgi:hypothetical protein